MNRYAAILSPAVVPEQRREAVNKKRDGRSTSRRPRRGQSAKDQLGVKVLLMVNAGQTYKQVGEKLNISADYVGEIFRDMRRRPGYAEVYLARTKKDEK